MKGNIAHEALYALLENEAALSESISVHQPQPTVACWGITAIERHRDRVPRTSAGSLYGGKQASTIWSLANHVRRRSFEVSELHDLRSKGYSLSCPPTAIRCTASSPSAWETISPFVIARCFSLYLSGSIFAKTIMVVNSMSLRFPIGPRFLSRFSGRHGDVLRELSRFDPDSKPIRRLQVPA